MFRPFKLEIEKIAGWHDGDKTHLQFHAIDNQIVRKHERVHAEIFSSTPDGILLSLTMKLASIIKNQSELDVAKTIISNHIENARIAHESAATFIGIKSLPEDLIENAIQSLPQEYTAYYVDYKNWVESSTKSTYLQVVIANAISSTIFSSNSIIEFSNSNGDLKALEYDFPNERHKIFGEWWLKQGRKSTLRYLHDALIENTYISSHVNFDRKSWGELNDDLFWKKNFELARYIENFSIALIYEYLVAESPLNSIDASSSVFIDKVNSIKTTLVGEHFELRFVRKEKANPKQTITEGDATLKFKESINTTIHLNKIKPTRDISNEKKMDEDALYELISDEKYLLSFCFDGIDFINNLVVIEVYFIKNHLTLKKDNFLFDAEFTYYAKCSVQLFFMLNLELMYATYFRRPHAYVNCCLIPRINSIDKLEYEGYKALCHTHPKIPVFSSDFKSIISDKKFQVLPFVFVEYMNEQFFDFLERNKHLKMEYFCSTLNILDTENLSIIALKASAFAGWKLKIISSSDLADIIAYFHIVRPDIVVNNTGDTCLIAACQLILSHWKKC